MPRLLVQGIRLVRSLRPQWRRCRGSGLSAQGLSNHRGYFIVEFHPDTDMNRARGTLLNLGLIPLDNPDLNPSHLMFHIEPNRTAAALSALTLLDEVAYVFPASRELILNIPARYYAGALTTNGPTGQSIPTYGNGWDGPGLGAATINYVFSQMTAQLGSAAAQAEIVRAMAEWSKVAAITWQPGANALRLRHRECACSPPMTTVTATRLMAPAAFWPTPSTLRRPTPSLLPATCILTIPRAGTSASTPTCSAWRCTNSVTRSAWGIPTIPLPSCIPITKWSRLWPRPT